MFRQRKIVRSVVANGSGNESPPFFQRKLPDILVLMRIDESVPSRSAFVPLTEFGVFGVTGKCLSKRLSHLSLYRQISLKTLPEIETLERLFVSYIHATIGDCGIGPDRRRQDFRCRDGLKRRRGGRGENQLATLSQNQ